MRVTIEPVEAPWEGLSMVDGSPANLDAGTSLYLDRHPLEGWYDGVEPKTSAADNPVADGLYMPARLLLTERVVTVKGHQTRDPRSEGSSIGDMNLKTRLAALCGRELVLRVTDSYGMRETHCWVSGKLTSGDEDEMFGILRFTLILTCPDPLIYSAPNTYTAVDGRVTVENNGTASSWPTLIVSGSPKRVVALLNGRRIDWRFDGNPLASTAELDFATMIPTVGSVSSDDGFQVPPGKHMISVSVTGNANVFLRVRSAWR